MNNVNLQQFFTYIYPKVKDMNIGMEYVICHEKSKDRIIPFGSAAKEAADQQFDTDSFNNLIELTVQNDDELVDPENIAIGQIVNIITNGTSYGSILTGIERSFTTKLIFGNIRLDLTKILKGGGI